MPAAQHIARHSHFNASVLQHEREVRDLAWKSRPTDRPTDGNAHTTGLALSLAVRTAPMRKRARTTALILLLGPSSVAAVPTVGLAAWQRAVAGMSAYCAATIISSPVDVVKTRMQAKSQQSRAIMPLVRSMVLQDGPLVFFSGLGPALLMAPAAVVQVCARRAARSASPLRCSASFALPRSLSLAHLTHSPHAQYTLMDPLREALPLVAAALIAGTLDITLKVPFDRLKTQLQSGSQKGKASSSAILLMTWRSQGIRGLWAGYGATLARDVPYLVLKWLTYVWVQSLVLQLSHRIAILASAKNLIAGAIAGAVAATAVTPADVVKTRMQVAGHHARPTAVQVCRELYAEGGLPIFFRGIGPRLLRIPVYTAVTLATFDLVKDSFSVANLEQAV